MDAGKAKKPETKRWSSPDSNDDLAKSEEKSGSNSPSYKPLVGKSTSEYSSSLSSLTPPKKATRFIVHPTADKGKILEVASTSTGIREKEKKSPSRVTFPGQTSPSKSGGSVIFPGQTSPSKSGGSLQKSQTTDQLKDLLRPAILNSPLSEDKIFPATEMSEFREKLADKVCESPSGESAEDTLAEGVDVTGPLLPRTVGRCHLPSNTSTGGVNLSDRGPSTPGGTSSDATTSAARRQRLYELYGYLALIGIVLFAVFVIGAVAGYFIADSKCAVCPIAPKSTTTPLALDNSANLHLHSTTALPQLNEANTQSVTPANGPDDKGQGIDSKNIDDGTTTTIANDVTTVEFAPDN